MSKTRITNSSELDVSQVTHVSFDGLTFRIALADGSVKNVRAKTLTVEGRKLLDQLYSYFRRKE